MKTLLKDTNPATGLLGVAALALLLCATAYAHEGGKGGSPDDIPPVRDATIAFRDVKAAENAGYKQFQDCKSESGQGAMGTHYLNEALAGDPTLDPLRPEALMYETKKTGELELVGVEYIVFQNAWDAAHPQPPAMFGHQFHLVREPNRYSVPAFYELHLWLYRPNRYGIFSDWNPDVSCPAAS